MPPAFFTCEGFHSRFEQYPTKEIDPTFQWVYFFGAECRIRTYEGECQQIYSLSCLTASLTPHNAPIRLPELNVRHLPELHFRVCTIEFTRRWFNHPQYNLIRREKIIVWSLLSDSNPRNASGILSSRSQLAKNAYSNYSTFYLKIRCR